MPTIVNHADGVLPQVIVEYAHASVRFSTFRIIYSNLIPVLLFTNKKLLFACSNRFLGQKNLTCEALILIKSSAA